VPYDQFLEHIRTDRCMQCWELLQQLDKELQLMVYCDGTRINASLCEQEMKQLTRRVPHRNRLIRSLRKSALSTLTVDPHPLGQ